jgi:hypothetical protein
MDSIHLQTVRQMERVRSESIRTAFLLGGWSVMPAVFLTLYLSLSRCTLGDTFVDGGIFQPNLFDQWTKIQFGLS